MKKQITLFAMLFLSLFVFSFLHGQENGGFKMLYQVNKDEGKIIKAVAQQELGKLLYWEKGRIMAKDINSAAGWRKYLDFNPEDLGIRLEEGKIVRIIEPGLISGFYHLPEMKKMAFLMHLGDSINSVLGVADLAMNKVIYTNLTGYHPQVAGRRMEFMAINNLNTTPCLSEDGRFAAYGAFTYLYVSNVEVVDLSDRTKTVIKNGYSPFIWKDRLYYSMRDEKKKMSIYSAALNDLKGEKLMDVDFEVSVAALHRGVYYILSDKKIYSCRLDAGKSFTLIGDLETLGTGYDKSEIQKFFVATTGKKDHVFVFMREVRKEKVEYKMYSREVN